MINDDDSLVRLGETEFRLPEKYQLGEIKRASSVAMRELSTELEKFELEGFDQAVEIVVLGLKRLYPHITIDKIYEMPMEVEDLWNAKFSILRRMKLLKEVAKPGESQAGTEAPPGSGSTENSAPA